MERDKWGISITTYTCMASVLSAVALLSGCQTDKQPRLRFGAFFGSPIAMEFADPEHLGTHHFNFNLNEKNGMVYTCRGGFIDLGHLREAADRTAYLREVTYRNLMGKKTKFSFRVIEPSRYWVKLSYPENWDNQSPEEKEKTANEVSIQMGQYFAHISLVWHEILTWYGFSTSGIFSEKISAFSWEDTYSDLLGTNLAVQALGDSQQQFDDAMTKLIYQKLKELDVQPPEVARRAAKQIEGEWFTGGFYFFVDMKKQNFEVGMNDDYITPWLVPGICPNAKPQLCPATSLELLSRHGFKMKLEIEPRVWEKGKIYHSINMEKAGNRIQPEVHFPKIMEQIKKEAG